MPPGSPTGRRRGSTRASGEHDDVERLAGMAHLNGIHVAIEAVEPALA